MKNANTGCLGLTNNNYPFTRPSSPRNVFMRGIGAAVYSAYRRCRMTNAVSGFTLIELLVVVLIIGILASVALPQYNKAVRKARLSEVATTFSSISKGIDMWLLENAGYGDAVFLGTNKTAELNTSIPCTSEGPWSGCSTKIGNWTSFCETNLCRITFTSSGKWLGGSGETLDFFRYPSLLSGTWGLDVAQVGDETIRKEVCLWWRDMYGADRFVRSFGELSTQCNEYF